MEFERNPWLLVPFVIAIVEGWNLLKAVVRSYLNKRSATQLPTESSSET